MLEVLNNNQDRDKWIELWNCWVGKEVFAHPDYISLFSDDKSEVLCATFKQNNTLVLYPFILRSLRKEGLCNEELYDITTAYGYSDIYIIGESNEIIIADFFDKFEKWALEKGVISEFIRFNLFSEAIKYFDGEVQNNNKNICVDVTLSKEQMWNNFKQKVRKNVNKAMLNNISIEVDRDGAQLDTFLSIYYSTMDRRSASKGYYFGTTFFENIVNNLKGSFVFFHAKHNGVIISTELVLVSDSRMYSFLGGTLDNFFDLRPNDYLKFEIINWGRENGMEKFILGGGYIPEDGIFKYKEAFAPNGVVDFFVGKKIYDTHNYSYLVENKVNTNSNFDIKSLFFPLYRA